MARSSYTSMMSTRSIDEIRSVAPGPSRRARRSRSLAAFTARSSACIASGTESPPSPDPTSTVVTGAETVPAGDPRSPSTLTAAAFHPDAVGTVHRQCLRERGRESRGAQLPHRPQAGDDRARMDGDVTFGLIS